MINGDRAVRTSGPDRHARTPFGIVDELSCYYDGAGEPNNVHLEAWLPGHLDHRALRDAVAATLAAQPRARARRVPGRPWRRHYAWEYPLRPDTDPVSLTTWADEADLAGKRASFLAAAPSLDTSPPVRLLLASGPGRDCLILNAHHAAVDGISCLQLLHSIAARYGSTREDRSRETAPADRPNMPGPPGRLTGYPPADGTDPVAALRRGTAAGPLAGPAAARRAGRVPQAAPPNAGLRAIARDLAATRIAAQRGDTGPSWHRAPGYGFHLMTWPWAPLASARRGEHGGTVNDILIAAMILAIGNWNGAHGRPGGRIRITMPLAGRQGSEDATAMGNLSRLATVTVTPGRGEDGPGGFSHTELITDVARQTRYAKENTGPQVDLLCQALAAAWCPAALKHRALRVALRTLGPLMCDTSLISNLGNLADPPRFGAAAPTRMWFSTSAHMPRGLSLGAITIGGELHLCFRYRRALFDETAAAQFAAVYTAALSMLTNAGPER